MQNYYSKKIHIPTVNKSGEITGKIERWEAHKKGILHKAFSVVVIHINQAYLQIRKHPVFDGVVDVTASSHPEMVKGKMEHESDAVIRCLKREWHVSVTTGQLNNIGSIYYKSKDPKSEYIEHEYCTFYLVELNKPITPDPEFAYGFISADVNYLMSNYKNFNVAPWVIEGMKLF